MNFPDTLSGLVNECITHYQKSRNITNKDIVVRRQQLQPFIKKFHIESNTFNEKIRNKIESLNNESTLVLMTAHQPNLFPYSGVLRKSTLLYALQNELEKRLGVDVVSFYGIADQDFTDDRWVKSTVLPSITKKGGLLTLNINLPEKVILKNIPKPDHEVLKKWEETLNTWIRDSTKSIRKYSLKNGFTEWDDKSNIFQDNFETFWNMVETTYEISQTYADFNSFLMSKIVNKSWGYDTLFARFSECQTILDNEFAYILKNFKKYSTSLNEILEHSSNNNERGVAEFEPESIPFWYHCECGGKVRLRYSLKNEDIFGQGICNNCRKEFEIPLGKENHPSISKIKGKISARAIPMILIFSKGLDLTCYIGGVGGKEYLDEAEQISKKININMPIISYWRPSDYYLSLSYVESILEYNRINNNYEISKWSDEKNIILAKIENAKKEIMKLEIERNTIIEAKKDDKIKQEYFISEMKKISREINKIRRDIDIPVLQANIKELDNISQVFTNIPSIIDYVVNMGLKTTSIQWLKYLEKNGSLKSNLVLTSNLEEFDCTKNNINKEIYKTWQITKQNS